MHVLSWRTTHTISTPGMRAVTSKGCRFCKPCRKDSTVRARGTEAQGRTTRPRAAVSDVAQAPAAQALQEELTRLQWEPSPENAIAAWAALLDSYDQLIREGRMQMAETTRNLISYTLDEAVVGHLTLAEVAVLLSAVTQLRLSVGGTVQLQTELMQQADRLLTSSDKPSTSISEDPDLVPSLISLIKSAVSLHKQPHAEGLDMSWVNSVLTALEPHLHELQDVYDLSAVCVCLKSLQLNPGKDFLDALVQQLRQSACGSNQLLGGQNTPCPTSSISDYEDVRRSKAALKALWALSSVLPGGLPDDLFMPVLDMVLLSPLDSVDTEGILRSIDFDE